MNYRRNLKRKDRGLTEEEKEELSEEENPRHVEPSQLEAENKKEVD